MSTPPPSRSASTTPPSTPHPEAPGLSTPVLLPYSLPVSNADLETYVRYAREVGYLKKPVDVGQMLAR